MVSAQNNQYANVAYLGVARLTTLHQQYQHMSNNRELSTHHILEMTDPRL